MLFMEAYSRQDGISLLSRAGKLLITIVFSVSYLCKHAWEWQSGEDIRNLHEITCTSCLSESAPCCVVALKDLLRCVDQRAPARLPPLRCMATHTPCMDEFILSNLSNLFRYSSLLHSPHIMWGFATMFNHKKPRYADVKIKYPAFSGFPQGVQRRTAVSEEYPVS